VPLELAQVTHYIIYFAEDSIGLNRTYFGNTSVGVENITVPTDTALLNSTHFVVYTLSSLVEQTTPIPHLIFDAFSSVTDVGYVGKDLDQDHLGGVISWTPPVAHPTSLDRIDGYVVYMAYSSAGGPGGVGRSQINGLIPYGTNEVRIYPETLRLDYNFMVVYTQSALVEQTTPTSLLFYDTFSQAVNFSFIDDDLDPFELGGTLLWVAPPDYIHITQYFLYFAEIPDSNLTDFQNKRGFYREFINNVSYGTNELFIPTETPIRNFTHFFVYTASSLAEASTPATLVIIDESAPISNLVFIDKDLDIEEIGGTIVWTGAFSTRVILYRVYFATDAVGANRYQHRGNIPFGTNDLIVLPDYARGNVTDILVYSASILAEQTTPVALKLYDSYSPVSYVTMPDRDLDFNEIGGLLTWSEPIDIAQVTTYVVYFSNEIVGTTRARYGHSPVGTPELDVTPDEPFAFTHMLVYSNSSLHEATTPVATLLSDVGESVSRVEFVDKDLDELELHGVVTWAPPGYPGRPERVQAYNVYMALSDAGLDRVPLYKDVTLGINRVVLPLDMPVFSQTILPFNVTCDFTIADEVDAVYYNGEDITSSVVGELKFWSSPKQVTFTMVEGAYLVIMGHSRGISDPGQNACLVSGFQMNCSNGVTTADDWEVHGSDGPVDELYKMGLGSEWGKPCSSSSGFFLRDSPLQPKLASKKKYAAFRIGNWTDPDPTPPTWHFSHIVVYTQSTLTEQTTPVAVDAVDNMASVGPMTFVDTNVKQEEVGGVLLWTMPDDVSQVTYYNTYLAEDVLGANRLLIGSVASTGSNFTVPSNTYISSFTGNYTHFLVYSRSSLVEQTTPVTLVLYDDLMQVCDEIPGVECGEPGVGPAAGSGACSTTAGCNDCGLSAARIRSLEASIAKGAISLIAAEAHYSTHDAMATLTECGINAFAPSFFNARGIPNSATGGQLVMCRYSCLPDLSECRYCHPQPDNSTAADAPDADGMSIWRYLSCKYRGLSNPTGAQLAYSYLFNNGVFVGTGTDLKDKLDCDAMKVATAGVIPFDLSNVGCSSADGSGCVISVLTR